MRYDLQVDPKGEFDLCLEHVAIIDRLSEISGLINKGWKYDSDALYTLQGPSFVWHRRDTDMEALSAQFRGLTFAVYTHGPEVDIHHLSYYRNGRSLQCRGEVRYNDIGFASFYLASGINDKEVA